MVNLEPEMPIGKNEMVKLLEATQYRQVSKMMRPGEFTVQAKSIEMIRRPFDFPDSKEGLRARLTLMAIIWTLSRIWITTASSVSSVSIHA
jgi:penicillin-binding protein 1B